ncbi:MAG: hypothetical protein EBQ99_10115, partial [Planctomycetes bacterium]|nr:hypothetical protein [Planctomycetota bacterium]
MRRAAMAAGLSLLLGGPRPASAQMPVARIDPLPAPAWLAPSDCLGSSVAVDGGSVFAGSRGRDDTGPNAGAIARWERNGQTWLFRDWLPPPRAAAGQEFGHAIAAASGLLACGAPLDDLRGTDAGAAWLLRPAAVQGWDEAHELMPPEAQAGERFGSTVRLLDAMIVVSAPRASVGTNDRAGRVVVFEPSGSGWLASAVLTPPMPAAGMMFGESLDATQDRIAVGCPAQNMVHVFRRVAGIWTHEDSLPAPTITARARFGQSLRLQGDSLLVSEPRAPGGGCVHAFEFQGGSWVHQRISRATEAAVTPDWAWTLGGAGDRLAMGASRHVVEGVTHGSVSLWSAGEDPARELVLAIPASPEDLSLFGAAIAMSSETLAVGSPGQGSDPLHGGAVYAVSLSNDCNADGVADALAIASGAEDLNCDAVPDACQCTQDLDGDAEVSASDISLVLVEFGATGGCLGADL